jgi:hypothetical protein
MDELHMALVQWMTEQTLESLCRMIGEAEKFYGQIVAA